MKLSPSSLFHWPVSKWVILSALIASSPTHAAPNLNNLGSIRELIKKAVVHIHSSIASHNIATAVSASASLESLISRHDKLIAEGHPLPEEDVENEATDNLPPAITSLPIRTLPRDKLGDVFVKKTLAPILETDLVLRRSFSLDPGVRVGFNLGSGWHTAVRAGYSYSVVEATSLKKKDTQAMHGVFAGGSIGTNFGAVGVSLDYTFHRYGEKTFKFDSLQVSKSFSNHGLGIKLRITL